jgi:RpiR family carbohydrate utilization transcriptional regulator
MLDRIKVSLSTLAPAEQRVAKLALADAAKFVTLPITELADRAHVSKPTVVRFCRSMGYDGLTDFKRKLAGNVKEGVAFIHRSVDENDKTSDVLVKVVDNCAAALVKYRNDASSMGFEKATEALLAAYRKDQRLEIFGNGNSGVVALDAQLKFSRLGLVSHSYTDGHLQISTAAMLHAGDCLMLVSNSGKSRDLLQAATIGRAQGATTIAITASGSPLARQVDIAIAADHFENAEVYSPMVSRILHLVIVDVLSTALALKIGVATLAPVLRQVKDKLKLRRIQD